MNVLRYIVYIKVLAALLTKPYLGSVTLHISQHFKLKNKNGTHSPTHSLAHDSKKIKKKKKCRE